MRSDPSLIRWTAPHKAAGCRRVIVDDVSLERGRSPSGSTLQRRCSKSMASMLWARSSSAGSSGARRYWRYLPSCRRVSSTSKLAVVRITGRARSPRSGNTVKLMPPNYVKVYVKRGKTDAGDAAAICEAVGDRDCQQDHAGRLGHHGPRRRLRGGPLRGPVSSRGMPGCRITGLAMG